MEWNLKSSRNGMELDSLILCVWFNYGMESTFLFFTISLSLLTSHSSLASLASSLLTVAWPRRPAGHVLLQPRLLLRRKVGVVFRWLRHSFSKLDAILFLHTRPSIRQIC
uniref:Uncharacterized protein n=1 Tax=Opuntia streptacantha TaxID=393608 RepID=A0A7C8YSD8_OPUST